MKKQALLFALVMILGSVLTFSTGALAPDLAAAKGGNGGGGGGGGGTQDYGDLIILYRDLNGVPIPSPETPVEDPETGELVDGGLCWQPIAFNVDDAVACPESCVVATTDPATVLVNQYTCGVEAGCSGCTQEVEFGRTNEARSPDSVFDEQLADAVVELATADCRTLDPAGRLVASRELDDLSVDSKTIDSPLQNLAIYRGMMFDGTIGVPLPEAPQGAGILDTAARGLGVAVDKTGEVNVDIVAYLNQIMGLTDPDLCETYREEVQGTIQLVKKCFFDYSAYAYERSGSFGALPSPAYIPADGPLEGTFEYLVQLTDEPTFGIEYGLILGAVFGTDPGFLDGNIGGFAQAADDTRAVINFMHNNPVPGDPTPVACVVDPPDPEDPPVLAYDVSISEESGLQVPRQLVDGSEGREFVVTVANASGSADPASGTVTVTATPENVDTIEGSPWTFEFIDLAVGASESWTTFFSIDLGARTTINWTAEADAEFDVNDVNDIVTATTNVRTTGGGGGGGRR